MINSVNNKSNIPVRALLSLCLIYLATLMDWYWLWGALILFWATIDLLNDQVWLSEIVTRRANPVIFYMILFTWFLFGFYLLLIPLIPLIY